MDGEEKWPFLTRRRPGSANPTNAQRGERKVKRKWIVSAGVALALGALATVTVAERAGKMRGPWQPMPMIPEHLDLTDEQKEQFKDLRKGHMEAMREQREAVMKILTEEQQETLKEMRAKRRKFFGQRGGGKGRHDMRRGDKDAFSRLDLTEEQKEQLKELREEHRAEIRGTRQKHRTALENVLSDEQREKLEEMKDEAFYGGDNRWRGRH